MTKKDLEQPPTDAVPNEGQNSDCKSLRKVTGKTADFAELAQDCVCFANGSGGQLLIGIEDGETAPPVGQRIDPTLSSAASDIHRRVGSEIPDRTFRRALEELVTEGSITAEGREALAALSPA